MKAWDEIREFFSKERFWGIFFLVIFGIYTGIFLWQGRVAKEREPSEAVESLRQAEAKLKEEIRAPGGLKQVLSEKPELLLLFNVFTLLLVAGVASGIILDLVWLFRPRWRRVLAAVHGPPEASSWSIKTIFKIILLFMAATLSLSLFLAFLKSILFLDWSANFLILVHTTLSDILCIVLVVYFIQRFGGSWHDLGFKGGTFWRDVGVGLAAYLAILPIFLIVLIVLVVGAQIFAYEPPPHALVEVFLEEEKRAPGLIVYSIFLACVAGPLFEETFFRGFCYPAFKKRWGVWPGLFLSAAFFGLIHQNLFAFVPIFVLGLILGYLYEKTGSLVPSIVLHIIHNSIFIGYFFLAKEVLEAAGIT
jgi:membrane protease YdiL (CAAX protease family)